MKIFLILIFIVLSSLNIFSTENLVKNPSFENIQDNVPENWTISAWDKNPGTTEFTVEKNIAHSAKKSFCIKNKKPNDARLVQNIKVMPDKFYKYSAFVLAKNCGSKSLGAVLSFTGKMETSTDLKETNNKWQKLELYFFTSDLLEVNITAGIGGFSSTNTGTAYFDDISVEEVLSVPQGAKLVNFTKEIKPKTEKPEQKKIRGPTIELYIFSLTAILILIISILYYLFFIRNKKKTIGEDIDAEK